MHKSEAKDLADNYSNELHVTGLMCHMRAAKRGFRGLFAGLCK